MTYDRSETILVYTIAVSLGPMFNSIRVPACDFACMHVRACELACMFKACVHA